MKITKKEWDEKSLSYCCETNTKLWFWVKMVYQQNRLRLDYRYHLPVLDEERMANAPLTGEEMELIHGLIEADKEFQRKTDELWSRTRYI